MAEQGLQLNIGANVSDLEKGLAQGTKSIQNFDAKAQAAGASISKGLTKGSNQAAFALTNLGRVASDAPFGFIAIQNNLDPLIQSFGQLSKTSGGTGAALKALGASLLGPAGIAVAFSVVSAAITVAVQKYGSLGAAFQALFSSNRALLEQQKQIADIYKEANKQAGESVVKFRYLSEAVANTALSDAVRADALKKLKEEYPAYLKNLTDDQIFNGALKTTIEEVTKSLRARAVAQAAISQSADIERKILEDKQKQIEAVEEFNALVNQKPKNTLITGFGSADAVAIQIQQRKAKEEELQGIAQRIAANEKRRAIILNIAQIETQAAGDGAIAAGKQSKALTEQEAKQKKLLEEKIKGYEIELKTIENISGAASKAYIEKARLIEKSKADLSLIGVSDPALIAEINNNLALSLTGITSKLTAQLSEQNKKFKASLNATLEDLKKDVKVSIANVFDEIDKFQAVINVKVKVEPPTREQLMGVQGFTESTIPLSFDLEELNNIDNTIRRTSDSFTGLQKSIFDSIIASKRTIAGFKESSVSEFAALSEGIAKTASTIQTIATPFIDAFFDAIERGQNAFKALGNAIKGFVIGAIKELVKLAAVAATISILSAAVGAPIPFGAAFKMAAGGSRFGQSSAPNFSGVQGGAIAVTVGGQFNVRGTDLVAVVNQSNQRIGRVG